MILFYLYYIEVDDVVLAIKDISICIKSTRYFMCVVNQPLAEWNLMNVFCCPCSQFMYRPRHQLSFTWKTTICFFQSNFKHPDFLLHSPDCRSLKSPSFHLVSGLRLSDILYLFLSSENTILSSVC